MDDDVDELAGLRMAWRVALQSSSKREALTALREVLAAELTLESTPASAMAALSSELKKTIAEIEGLPDGKNPDFLDRYEADAGVTPIRARGKGGAAKPKAGDRPAVRRKSR